MKSTGTQYWFSPNTAADNSSGFSGLPGGMRYGIGPFSYVGEFGDWWSSTELNAGNAWFRELYNEYGLGITGHNGKGNGASVRCLRD